MKPIKRTDAEWMMVWNNPDHKVRRLVIHLFDDGACLAVSGTSEGIFMSGDRTAINYWSHREPFPKKKTRPMTADERVLFCCQNPTIAVRYYPEATWMAGPGEWIPGPAAQWCTTDGGKYGEPQDFVIEVEE